MSALKMVKFPTSINSKTFFLGVVICYILFCFHPYCETLNKTFDFKLFANDFNLEGALGDFVNFFVWYFFVGFISYAACVMIQDRLFKSIFFAIIIDACFNLLNLIVFGYIYDLPVLIIRNGSVVLSFFLAYLVLFKSEDTKWN